MRAVAGRVVLALGGRWIGRMADAAICGENGQGRAAAVAVAVVVVKCREDGRQLDL